MWTTPSVLDNQYYTLQGFPTHQPKLANCYRIFHSGYINVLVPGLSSLFSAQFPV